MLFLKFGEDAGTIRNAKRPISRFLVTTAVVLGFAGPSPAAAETRDFVVSWWMQAANSSKDDSDCPQGINPSLEELVRQQLLAVDIPKAEVENAISVLNGGAPPADVVDMIMYRGRHNGKPMHVYTFPSTVPDVPGMTRFNLGPEAYGFNLDGNSKTGYTEADTKEAGIDNGFWRATGCFISHRGSREKGPTHGIMHWDLQRDKQPAWAIRVVADDFTKDGDVTVSLYRAMERVWRDANGDVRRYSTFRIDPDKRWQSNTLKGKIKNGEVTVSGEQLHLLGDPYVLTDLDMNKAQFRFKLDADGNLEGVLGGYIPWITIFYEYGSSGFTTEFMTGVNLPAMYWALRKSADGSPDPKTGENTTISSAYRVAAVPAFLVTKDQNEARR